MVSQVPLSQEFVFLRDAMNQLLEESFVPSGGRRWPEASSSTRLMARPLPLDVYATPDDVVIIAAVPGMNSEDLEITYNQSTVTLSGSMPSAMESEQGKNATWCLHELWSGKFQRSLTLPVEVDPSKAEAIFDNGIVRITLPKAEWTRPRKIAITAGSDTHEAVGPGGQQTSR